MFLGILPLVLTNNQTNIKFKWFLCWLQLLLAIPLFIYKLWMIVKFKRNPDSTKYDQNEEMWNFLGVYGSWSWVTLVIDVIQILICAILVWHLKD